MSATLALQSALIAALRADADLTTLLGGEAVYDGAPQGADLPHVTLADLASLDLSGAGAAGQEHFATFHVFSRDGGRRQALEILAAMTALLDDAALSVAGHTLVNLAIERTEARRQADGKTWRGMMRVRAVTEAD
jgi:Protein of unknown function (DUF3168)